LICPSAGSADSEYSFTTIRQGQRDWHHQFVERTLACRFDHWERHVDADDRHVPHAKDGHSGFVYRAKVLNALFWACAASSVGACNQYPQRTWHRI
jgi:hypothetical protein